MWSLRWNIATNPDKALRPTAMKRSGIAEEKPGCEKVVTRTSIHIASAAFGGLDDTDLAQPGALRIGAREGKKGWTDLETHPAVWLATLRQDGFFKIRKETGTFVIHQRQACIIRLSISGDINKKK
jgi:hypothetical protein